MEEIAWFLFEYCMDTYVVGASQSRLAQMQLTIAEFDIARTARR
jgi:hypothetical protein